MTGTRPRSGPRVRVARWVIACMVLAFAALMGARTEHHVAHDAAFCATSCHHDRTPGGAWHAKASGHDQTECQQCHETSLASGLRLFAQSLTKTSRPVTHGKVAPGACRSCHEKDPVGWRLVAETQGHRQHRDAPNVDCLSCHGPTTHGTTAPEAVCTTCHKNERLHMVATAGAETCLSCHGFAASPKNRTAPTTSACVTCHDSRAELTASVGEAPDATSLRPMKDVNAHVLHGDVACQLCHNAHGVKPKVPEGQPACARCHQVQTNPASLDPKGPDEHRNCEGCHEPHAPLESAISRCVDCHAQKAKGLVANEPPGLTSALKHKACTSCHLPHSWKADLAGCMDCHKDQARLIATRSPPQHDKCTTCHEVHGPPPSGAVCLKCHSDTKGNHVALAPERHKDCTSCHSPHAPRPEETRASCAKCHETENTQVTTLGPQGHTKDGCIGCHQPHDNPLPEPGVCTKCHEAQATAVTTAPQAAHRACTSCHEKHVFEIPDPKAACAKCHGPMFDTSIPGQAKVPHDGDCKSCHTLHGPPAVAQTACLTCHEDVKAKFHPPNASHAACGSCHAPHKPATQAPARCTICHAAEAAVATKWPAASAHAQACTSCHAPHDAREKKPCVTCHAAETASAVGSKHQCTQCHAPHRAPPSAVGSSSAANAVSAWWTTCDQCHADKAASVKERGPKHSECKSCHEEHRFAIPTCTTCHKDVQREGLHAIPKHFDDCTSCHDPHVKSQPTPKQCLTCHTDRQNHEPNAARCQACHTFK